MSLLLIDKTLCAKTGACIDNCPYSLIVRGAEGFPEEGPGADEACVRCGHCVAVCPTGALSNTLLDRKDFIEVASLKREADPLEYVMRTRRSGRSFRPEAVPKAQLKTLFDVVRHAPTGKNTQNLWWIVTTGREQTKPLAVLARQWLRQMIDPNKPDDAWETDDDPLLRGAPHLALCCGPTDSRWGVIDAAIAVTHLDLLAASRGIEACWAGAFLRAIDAWPPLQEVLALPPGQRVYGGLFFGYSRNEFRLVPPRKPSAVDWR